MKKIVIYTCLFGKYDSLFQPLVIDDDFEYICFSNDLDEDRVGVWNIVRVTLPNADSILLSRFPKLMPHVFLKDYDYSLYMDANLQIVDVGLYEAIHRHVSMDTLIAQMPHISPPCDCIYEEIPFAIMCGKTGFWKAYKQYFHLKNEGFPAHYGLFENNVIFRKHNDSFVKKISKCWYDEFCKYAKRDQFSLMYVYWKYSFLPTYIFDNKISSRNCNSIKYVDHPQKYNDSLITKARKYLYRQMYKIGIFVFMR